jgi:hypothetical protein
VILKLLQLWLLTLQNLILLSDTSKRILRQTVFL